MKSGIKTIIAGLILLFVSSIHSYSAKVNVPISIDGAWSLNTQPAAVYHQGSAYFSWINSAGDLMLSSYNQSTDEVKVTTVASGYGTEDFASPALLVRASGQILIFASKNTQEAGFQCYRSTSVTGDITAGFSVQTMTGYGISATLPFVLGDNIVVFWRSKNNFGYTFVAGANTIGATGALGAGARAGFLNTEIANNYQFRDEVPTIRATQGVDGTIHMVITQLGTGLKYSNSTIHYIQVVNNNNTGILFRKADGTNTTLSYAAPADVVYATNQATDKAIAYDIALIDNKPVIVYDAFNGENVNAATNPGSSSNHTYKIAKWDGTQWNSFTVVEAGDGLPISQYTAVGGKTFLANAYQVGGACFDVTNPSVLYLSKKINTGTFELFRYESTNAGESWTESEVLTSETASGLVNIRPIQVVNSPVSRQIDLLWLQGQYTSPKTYSMSVVSRGQGMPASSIAFDNNTHYFAINETKTLNVRFSPLFVENREVALHSSDTDVAIITAEGLVKAVGAGSATITATATSNSSLTATCQIVVEETPVFDVFMQRIVNDAFAERISNVANLVSNVTGYLAQLQPNGSFSDVNYASTDRTNWEPLVHLNRMVEMALAYTYSGSSLVGDATLKSKLDLMLQYWQSQAPYSTNWYQNEIGEPQRMGLFLILMKYAGSENVQQTLFNNAIVRLRDKGGNPGAQAGANRVDVALHWMYRACLTADRNLLQTAMDYIYSPIEYTTGSEGIQYDNSYTQHGRQLHIGSYGEVFMNGITTAAMYAVGTQFALPAEKLNVLSRLVKDTYLSVFRGQSIFFNVIGRASTRPGATVKQGTNKIVTRMAAIDPENAAVYNAANERFTGVQPSSYNLNSASTHFYSADYSLHKRPSYSADLRMVSTRTIRNEYLKDNFEGKRQYFLSDGAMGLFVDGNEYDNIFPVWNWAKIPGVTCPEFVDIPQLSTYIKAGQSDFVGGVSDSLNMVSVYKYSDSEFSINTSANKSWFFFDNEIVCLGSEIKSQATQRVNTTLNQTLLKGDVTVSVNGNQTTFSNGSFTHDNTVDWIYHGGVGYYFPTKAKIDLSAQQQSGNWFDINGNYSSDLITKDVFSLSIDHGVQPTAAKYAYILVPGLQSAAQAHTYNVSDIEILSNSDTVQAVYNKKSKVYGFVFLKACGFKADQLVIEVDAPCAVIVKDVENANAVVHVSDPSNSGNSVNLGISIPGLTSRRAISYHSASPHAGRSMKFIVNENTPEYTGRDILYDRTGWEITTSINGVIDEAVYGDNPLYIIDNDLRSAYVFIKPGKTYGGVTGPTDYLPSFTIDMKKQNNISFFSYRHRTYNNSAEMLRAKKLSFYGKNAETDVFTTILSNTDIAINVSEIKVQLPANVNYRYVKLEMNDWDNINGSTVQVSEFNMGYFGMTEFSDVNTDVTPGIQSNSQLMISPNPVRNGQILNVKLPNGNRSSQLKVFDVFGKLLHTSVGENIYVNDLPEGVYFLRISDTNTHKQYFSKFIVR